MYPEYDKYMVRAYADMFDRAVRGEAVLPKEFIFDKDSQQKEDKWDVMKEVEEQKQIGKVNAAKLKM